MEPNQKFISTDIQFHSRDFRPTTNLERAIEKAHKKGSKEFRIYGKPVLVVDLKTKLVYLRLQFPREIAQKMKDGTLLIKNDSPWKPDTETQQKLDQVRKKENKRKTRVWSK